MAKKLQVSDEFKELMRNQGITITLDSNTSLTLSEAYTPIKIPLNTLKYQRNNNLFTFTSNGIKVNKSGIYLICGNAMISSSDTAQTVLARIYKTGSTTYRLIEGYQKISSNGWVTISLTPIIIALDKNDIVYFGVGGSKTGNINVGGANSFTYLTILEI